MLCCCVEVAQNIALTILMIETLYSITYTVIDLATFLAESVRDAVFYNIHCYRFSYLFS